MSLFGTVNTEKLEKSLESGTYQCVLAEVKTFHSKDKDCPLGTDNGKHSIVFQWDILDEDSPSYGENFQQWYTIFPWLTDELFDSLDGKAKLAVKNAHNWLNRELRDLGLNPTSVTDISQIEDLAETVAYIDITVQPGQEEGQRGFVKVRSITLEGDSSSGGSFAF